DRAITELNAGVDRSVIIAATTTREILMKDFMRDPDEARVRRAGHPMVRALATALQRQRQGRVAQHAPTPAAANHSAVLPGCHGSAAESSAHARRCPDH